MEVIRPQSGCRASRVGPALDLSRYSGGPQPGRRLSLMSPPTPARHCQDATAPPWTVAFGRTPPPGRMLMPGEEGMMDRWVGGLTSNLCVCVCVCAWMWAHRHVHVHVHMYVRACMHISVFMCV